MSPDKANSPSLNSSNKLNLAIGLSIAAGLASFMHFNKEIATYFLGIQSDLQGHKTILAISAKWISFLIPALGAAYVYKKAGTRFSVATDIALTGLAAFMVSQLLHLLFPIDRPFVVFEVPAIIAHRADSSFPSDHATVGFAVGFFLLMKWRIAGTIACIAAITTGVTRVAVLLHWPSDVVTGAALGVSAALAIPWLRARFGKWLGPTGWRALFESDSNFRGMITALRYLAVFGVLIRFLTGQTNLLSSIPSVFIGVPGALPFVVPGICGLLFLYVFVTNRLVFDMPARQSKTHRKPENATVSNQRDNKTLWFAIIGDCAFFSLFYFLTGQVESTLFVLLLIPLVAASLFLDFTSTIQTLAIAVGFLALSIFAIWVTCATLESLPPGMSPKQWLTLNIFAPRAFALFLACIPIVWIVEKHSRLSHERKRYESLVECLPMMITRKNTDGIITYANRAFCDLNHLTLEQVIGKRDVDIYGPELAAKYQRSDDLVIMTKLPLAIEEKHRPHGTDTELDVEGHKIPVCNAAGVVVEVQVSFSDVTDRKRQAAALEHQRQQLDALMDNIPDNIYFKDLESRFTRVNKALAGYFKLELPSDAVGKSDTDFFMPEDAAKKLRDETKLLKTGEPLVGIVERDALKIEGLFWVSTTKMVLRDRDGRVRGTFGISRDITERMRAVAKLEASELKYRTIVEHANDIIYVRAANGILITINDAVERILGYTPKELIGRNVLDIMERDARKRVESRFKRGAPEDRVKDTVTREETAFLSKTGGIVVLEFTARAIPDPERNQALVVCVGHDVTERIAAQARLEKLVGEKDALIKEVHHGTKGSLGAVRNLLELRANHSTDEQTKMVLTECRERVRVMMAMYDEILSAGSFRALRLKPYLERVLTGIADDITLRHRNVRLVPKLDDIMLTGRQAMRCALICKELVTNCLTHAFLRQAGGEIVVELQLLKGGRVGLCVRDNGIGLRDDAILLKPQSLGCKLITYWATDLKGIIQVLIANGTSVTIDFPLAV